MSQADPLRWSADFLDSLDPDELHRVALGASASILRGRLLMGRCMLSMDRGLGYRMRGCNSSVHYAMTCLGVSYEEAKENQLVASRLETLPLLTEAAENNAIKWSALRLALRRATPENEAHWLKLAQTCSARRLEILVSQSSEGEATSEACLVKVCWNLDPDGAALLQHATRALCEMEGQRVPHSEILPLILGDFIAGARGCTREDVLEEIRRDLETPWETVDAQESQCPGNPEVTLVASPYWTKRIRFNEESRHVTEAQRKMPLRRDGYRCSTPGCPNLLWLEMHHIVFYSHGGATIPENVLTCCGSCHRNIHKGHLIVRGQAPHGLRWMDSRGREVGRSESVETEPWMLDWMDSS